MRGARHVGDGPRVHLASPHPEVPLVPVESGRVGQPGAAPGDGDQVAARAVRAEVGGDEGAGFVAVPRAQQERARAVAEDRGGVAVPGVDDGGVLLGADDQGVTACPLRDQGVGRGQGVQESGADGREVEGRHGPEAEPVGDVGRGRGAGPVGGGGGDQHQVGPDAGGGPHGGLPGGEGEVAGADVGGGVAAAGDAGTGPDPRVGGRQLAAGHDLFVGEGARGQAGADAADDGGGGGGPAGGAGVHRAASAAASGPACGEGAGTGAGAGATNGDGGLGVPARPPSGTDIPPSSTSAWPVRYADAGEAR